MNFMGLLIFPFKEGGAEFPVIHGLEKPKLLHTGTCTSTSTRHVALRVCLHGGGKNKTRLHTILQPQGVGEMFLEVVVALVIREFEHRRRKRLRKIDSRTRMYLSMKASRVVLRSVRWREELLTLYVIRNSLKYGRSITLNIPKCVQFTLLVCPLRFLVISAIRRLGKVSKHTGFALELFAMNTIPAKRVIPPWDVYMENCHPAERIIPPGRPGNPSAEIFFEITFWRSLDTRLNQVNKPSDDLLTILHSPPPTGWSAIGWGQGKEHFCYLREKNKMGSYLLILFFL